jgi:hypothetical protein
VLEPIARENALDRYASLVLPQELQRRKFLRIARCEAHVPALARHRHRPIAVAREARHAEPRAGAEDGDGSALDSFALRANGVQMLLIQQVDGEGERRKIIDQECSLEPDLSQCPL